MLKSVFVIQKSKEAYSEPCQTSKMILFVIMVDNERPLASFVKSIIFDMFDRVLNTSLEFRDLYAFAFVSIFLNKTAIPLQ